MLDPKQVIVYRSRSEQAFDQLVWDNPEIMAWGALILLLLVIGYFTIPPVLDWWRKR